MSPRLLSFDGTESVEGALLRPASVQEAEEAAKTPGWAPRGAGLSYCAAGLGPRTIAAGALDKILSFDEGSGLLAVEAGASLGAVASYLAARGRQLAVMPGHPAITIGGCVGSDVHGKNQHVEGCFDRCVESLTLFHPDKGEVGCSRAEHPDLFDLTIGGFGLTGLILRVTLRTQRAAAPAYVVERRAVRDYEDAVRVMEEREKAASLYSWHLPGGRGFVYAAEPAQGVPSQPTEWAQLDAAARGRGPALLNALTAPLALRAFELKERLSPGKHTVSAWQASFPVAGREFYFSLFGARGFREYQLLVPRPAFASFARELGALRRKHPAPITLASLKLFAGTPKYLRFEGPGVALAFDAPDGAHTRALWDALDPCAAAHGGTVNAAKDSRLSAAAAKKLFSGYDAFKQAIASWDPKRVVDTALRRRLDL